MKKKTILNLLFCLFILSNSSVKAEVPVFKKGIAIIQGKVNNLGKDSKAIRFAANGVVEKIEQTAIINPDGSFRLEIEMYHPQSILGFFKNRILKLFIHPTDSIYIEIDENLFIKENFPEFHISGTKPDSEISNEIQQYLRFAGVNTFKPSTEGKSTTEFLKTLNNEMVRQDSLLQSFCKTTKTSAEFNIWATKDIKYNIANYLVRYKSVNQKYEGVLFDESLFPVNDDEAILTGLYSAHLHNYALNLGFWQDTLTLRLLKEKKNIEAYQRCLDKILNCTKKGLSRDIMCYSILQSLFKESFIDYEVISKKNNDYIENVVLKTALQRKANEYKNKSSFNISFLDPVTDKEKEIRGEFWKELKEKYKGKIVYVDIWATWCGPCRAEIPYSIELHKFYQGKEVAFVNLCLSSNKNEWQKMVKISNISGENYFFNEQETQFLRNNLQFEGYPTYLIIDKYGTIVNKNAPRPSSGDEIRTQINKWINKDAP